MTGLTGFSGYLFGFPDESQKIQSPSPLSSGRWRRK
jgi:hypothetical protein